MTSIDLEDDVLLISDPVKKDQAIRALNKKRADRGDPPVYLNATSSRFNNIDPLYVEEIERQLSEEEIPYESVQICSVQHSDGTKTWRTMRPDFAFQVVCSNLFALQKKNVSLENDVWNAKIKAKSNKKSTIILIVLLLVISIGSILFIYSKNEEYSFYHNNAVLVTSSGEKYHKFSCQYVSGKTVKIFDSYSAFLNGYKPCSVCFHD